jgi:hypothetical protein
MAVPPDAASTPSAAEIDAITSRRFSNSFRGWDPDEVRVHLVGVAEIVRSLTQRQAELERLLAEAEVTARRADLTRLDPDEVSRVLGEETARVLRTAREAAAEIQAKATAQAELLARQAADDAARLRADAEAEATRVRNEAHETAEATRAAGEAHLADVQAAGEAELAREREEIEAELAAQRQAARDEAASQLALAQDHAATARREADEEAARVRAEAHEDISARRADLETEIAERRAATEEELAALTERAVAQVAEAERMRDRILADLARKRRAARQHLEQLHAGRDRLLTAYEVIRATTDQATGELDVVLGDAKRIADDAARRVGAEDLPTPEEMLAELDLARSAGLPIVAPAAPSTDRPGTDEPGTDEPGTDEAGADQPGSTGPADEPAESIEPSGGPVTVGAGAPSETSDSDSAAASAEPDEPARVEADTAVRPQPTGESPTNHRRHSRRSGHRRDPLDGGELPDVPMVPVEASAAFERVRVVPGPEPDDAAAAAAAPGSDAAEGSAGSTVPSTSAHDEPTLPDEVAAAEAPPAGAAAPGGDDAVSGIFARLRAEAEKDPDATGVESGDDPKPDETAKAPAKAATAQKSNPPAPPADGGQAKPPAPARAAVAPESTGHPKASERSDAAATSGPADEPEPADEAKAVAKAKVAGTPESAGRPGAGGKSRSAGKTNVAAGPAAAGKPKAAAGPEAAADPKAAAGPKGADEPKTAKAPTVAAAATSADAELASLFERRDAAVDEVGRRLTKHLKRALSDQQSSLLDDLRRHRGALVVDELLGAPETFGASWESVARADLLGAVAAGVALAGDLDPAASDHADVDVAGPTAELIGAIASPLRARLARALGEGVDVDVDDDAPAAAVDDLELADRIRACYREWRGARLATSVTDACALAFGLGVRAAVPATTGLRWHCGPGDGPCSDCNDNQLAGIVRAGQTFPTGQHVAPAHPGCRCLALPAPD